MSIRVLLGDCRETLATLDAGSVQAVITSPPYYGLRDYGSEPLVWGGGAWRGSLGLEPTPELYVEHLVECFRHVRRVLRDDGTLWLNLGDSYSSGGRNRQAEPAGIVGQPGMRNGQPMRAPVLPGIKPKDLLMVPFRVALALQQDGWYLRSVIPWLKRNSMPESVTDRPTTAVEYVFLLAKSARYFWDAEAVRVSASDNTHSRGNGTGRKNGAIAFGQGIKNNEDYTGRINGYISNRNRRNADWFFESWQGLLLDEGDDPLALVVNPAPFSGAHFATFPPALVKPMIQASTSERGQCPECGAPWERVTEKRLVPTQKAAKTFVVDSRDYGADVNDQGSNRQKDGHRPGWIRDDVTTGWQPTCKHDAAPVPQTILDPFGGAGTVGLVADRLGRDAILGELKGDYDLMARNRIIGDAPLFVQLDGMFQLGEAPPKVETDKQGASGLRRYVGFNARWDAQHG